MYRDEYVWVMSEWNNLFCVLFLPCHFFSVHRQSTTYNKSSRSIDRPYGVFTSWCIFIWKWHALATLFVYYMLYMDCKKIKNSTCCTASWTINDNSSRPSRSQFVRRHMNVYCMRGNAKYVDSSPTFTPEPTSLIIETCLWLYKLRRMVRDVDYKSSCKHSNQFPTFANKPARTPIFTHQQSCSKTNATTHGPWRSTNGQYVAWECVYVLSFVSKEGKDSIAQL